MASEGMYANNGGLAILNEDVRVCIVDCQATYKRGQGYLAKCSERDANAALIVRAVNNHDALVKALEQCGADFITRPGTVASCAQEVGNEFQRRLEIARAALTGAK